MCACATDSHLAEPDGLESRVVTLPGSQLASVTVAVRRHRRARHVRLHVDELGQVTASVPQRFAAARLDEIVRARGGWLENALLRMDEASRAAEVDLRRGDPVRLHGRWHPTSLQVGARASVRFDGDRFVITCPVAGDPHAALETWYRTHARTVFEQRVTFWAANFNLQHGAISIRNQRTRWGSCTHKADLSFNWRLVLAPEWVLDAIVVHELCHIDELNHSSRFWALLDQRFPQHRDAQAWLARNGGALRIAAPRGAGAVADKARSDDHDAHTPSGVPAPPPLDSLTLF